MASFPLNPSPSLFIIIIIIILVVVTVSLADELKTTHLHFYMHDTLSGPNVSAVRVVSGPSNNAILNFDDGFVFDDPLTEEANLTSKVIGRAQGIYVRASQGADLALLVVMNLVFLEGEYNGSTVAVVGRVPLLTPVRELAVVGGSGQFRLAGGYLVDKIYQQDRTNGNAISETNVYVTH